MFGISTQEARCQQQPCTTRMTASKVLLVTLVGLLTTTVTAVSAQLESNHGPRSIWHQSILATTNKHQRAPPVQMSNVPESVVVRSFRVAPLTNNESSVYHPRYATTEHFHNVPRRNPLVWDDYTDEGLATIEGMTTSTPYGFLNPRHLWPTPWKTSWTTHPSVPAIHKEITHFPLSDQNMGITRISGGTTRNVVSTNQTYAGTDAWEAVYPKGSINPGNANAPRGGFGWYMAGPGGQWAFDQAKEIMISYAVMFEPGFMFNKGGKLPGPYGGSTPDLAYGCSGGRQEDRDKCFSLRLMWRENGDGELYAYLPMVEENTERLLAVPPRSYQDSSYGFSVGRGAWRFQPGVWSVLAQRVKLNDLGEANGEIEIWHNGDRVIHVTGLVIRQAPNDSRFRGIHFQTFFGGSSPEWASPQDQKAYFADVTGSIIRL